MKRIFIAMHYLEIGGAENALIGLLHALDYSEVSVDLFLYARRAKCSLGAAGSLHTARNPGLRPHRITAERRLSPRPHPRGTRTPARESLAVMRRGKTTAGSDHTAIFSYIGRCVTPALPRSPTVSMIWLSPSSPRMTLCSQKSGHTKKSAGSHGLLPHLPRPCFRASGLAGL